MIRDPLLVNIVGMVSLASPTNGVDATRKFLSISIDLFIFLIGIALCLLLGGAAKWVAAVLFALIAIGTFVWRRGNHGDSIGHTVAKLRTVSTTTGLPSMKLWAPRVTVLQQAGQDPFHLTPRIVNVKPSKAAAPAPAVLPGLRLVCDNGSQYVVQHSAVVGRDPATPEDPKTIAISLPDLSRTISKSHFYLQAHDRGALVSDLASANGTWVDGNPNQLTANKPTLVPFGHTIVLGEQKITVQQLTRSADHSGGDAS